MVTVSVKPHMGNHLSVGPCVSVQVLHPWNWPSLQILLKKKTATHSSIHAWKIPWTKEPGGLQSTGSQRVGHNWATSVCLCVCQILLDVRVKVRLKIGILSKCVFKHRLDTTFPCLFCTAASIHFPPWTTYKTVVSNSAYIRGLLMGSIR